MATGPTFEPQIGPLGIVGAFQQGQSHQMSMMERAQSVKQQKLRTQMLEAQRQQWELEAPIRNAQLQTGLADAANQLYAAQELSKATAEVTSRGPEFMQMMKDADTQVNGADGKADYAVNYQKWSDIAKAVSPYAHTAKGKQMLEAANNQQLFYKTRIASDASFKMAEMKQKFEMEQLAAKHAATMEEAKARGVGQGKPIGITAGEIAEWEALTGEPSGLEPGNNVVIRRDDAGNIIAVSAPSVMYQSPSVAGQIAQGKAIGAASGKAVGEMLGAIEENASSSALNIEKRKIARQAMEGARESMGAAFSYELGLRQMGNYFGIGDKSKLISMEQLQKINADAQLEEAKRMKGQGQITEGERKLLAAAINNPNMTYESNLVIMDVMDAIDQLAIDKADLRAKILESNPRISEVALYNQLARFERNAKAKIFAKLYDIAQPPPETQAEPAATEELPSISNKYDYSEFIKQRRGAAQ